MMQSGPDSGSSALEAQIRRAVKAHLAGRGALSVQDRGEWVRRLFVDTLDGGAAWVIQDHRPALVHASAFPWTT